MDEGMRPLHTGQDAPTECVKEWRGLFSPSVLKKASSLVTMHMYEDFDFSEREAHAIIGQGSGMGRALIRNAPTRCSEDWDPNSFSCSCTPNRFRMAGDEDRFSLCVHEAALLLLWEKRRGPWRFAETREESEERLRREQEQAALEAERLDRERRREVEGRIERDAAPFFPRPQASDKTTYFQVRRAVGDGKTTLYALNRARELLGNGTIELETPSVVYDEEGHQALTVSGRVSDKLEKRYSRVTFSFRRIVRHECDCRVRPLFSLFDAPLCEHELVLLRCAQDYINKENPGDATDSAAERFFLEMDATHFSLEGLDAGIVRGNKTPCVTLFPRITLGPDGAKLSFKAGRDKKFLILKDLREFVEAVETESVYALGRTLNADFSSVTFTEDSLRWLSFIQRRVSETDLVNDRLQADWPSSASLPVSYQDDLRGAALDSFYDIAEGASCEFADRNRKKPVVIQVAHEDLKLRLTSQRIADADDAFLGIRVTGALPTLLEGRSDTYLLTDRHLSRLSGEERRTLRPFLTASNASGNISFFVGLARLAEFYYRVAPRLMASPYVEFVDRCADEAAAVLPPEPVFTFRLDLETDCSLEELVSYGGEPFRIPRAPDASNTSYIDETQEARVRDVILRYFPYFDRKKGLYHSGADDEQLYRILSEGVADLSRYGEVQGSDSFRRCAARSAPKIHVGVSVESGLLDISILSEDISPAELLDALESYRLKKTFHRLKNGDFLSLTDTEQLTSLDALMKELDLTPEDALRGRVRLPLYRALYVDAMLEKHYALASDRDRTYRALLRNFRAIRDADYEVPAAQADVLRPYQVYGYKWLRTLAAAGFGGILADEMGLGKTLQAITFLQALKEAGTAGPALIVCPASLVYNWQEEFHRFAPSLNAVVVAGTASVRRDCLADADADAYITSYDLLRQDITFYETLSFSVMILDEAQYIKNQKAGMTKAVKIVRAARRLALTGTPIENRLSELWSIFDFLMPGFLYSYPEFLRRFETPITRNKDPDAADTLKRMTSPFILRRLKSDVLTDLPPKLEEVRYTRFEAEQRKLYDGQVVHMRGLLTRAGSSGEDRIRIFAELMRIRQICCDPSLAFEDYEGGSAKRMACMELVQSAIGGGHRMLIFSQFASMLALLERDLQQEGIPCYKIIGATPKEQRIRMVKAFNEDDTPVFLISLKAGGTGLNLTGADVVIHYDPWWNLAAQNQATDRAHRIGQKNQVTVYRLIVKGSIEEKILSMQEAKKDLADAILSGESESLFTLSNEDLLELLQ